MEYIKQVWDWLVTPGSELIQILLVTLQMSCLSTIISSLIGMPLGVLLGTSRGRGRKYILRIVQTLMGLPPVVAGLIVYLFLSRSGPFGSLQLLFSVSAMVIAQVLLITPVVTGLTANFVIARAPAILETTAGLGIKRSRSHWLILCECRSQLIAVALTAFARAIAEVGAVSLVGGNIQWKTRVMTTSIMLETGKGNFEFAVALGALLLLLSLIVNLLVGRFQEERHG